MEYKLLLDILIWSKLVNVNVITSKLGPTNKHVQQWDFGNDLAKKGKGLQTRI